MKQSAKRIPANSVVKLDDGRVGRLEKNTGTKNYWVMIVPGVLAVEISPNKQIEMLHHPASIIDAYIATKYSEAQS